MAAGRICWDYRRSRTSGQRAPGRWYGHDWAVLSGIVLAAYLSLSPVGQPWLMAKIVGLIAYIALGVAAFRAPNRSAGKLLWISGLVAFAYIVSVAIRKTPLGFFS